MQGLANDEEMDLIMALGLSNEILMLLVAVGCKVGAIAGILQGSTRGSQCLKPA